MTISVLCLGLAHPLLCWGTDIAAEELGEGCEKTGDKAGKPGH